jgi:nicotinamidase/pyrazinamidase
MKRALLVVDLQNDFINGSLAVKDADKIINIINGLLPQFELVVFTQDWHPYNHKSFASQHEGKNVLETINLNGLQQTLWPDHCVQYSKGAEISKDIQFNKISGEFYIFKKGTDIEVDSYSAFYDNDRKNSTGLAEFLRDKEIEDVYICGIATDFCCKYTAIDASLEGFKTIFILDVTKPVNENITDTLNELKEANIDIIESWELSLFKTTQNG